jgi:catechol-2,3-dioxygenase
MKIKKLQLYTSNVKEQLRFYRDTLNLEVQNFAEDSFEVYVGFSNLKFQQKEGATAYHIAFHIPDKQHEIALAWVKERVPILRGNGQEIVDFSAWNAKSIYFYDADENIVEFISRKNLNKPESALFSAKSILGISEVGLATNNIQEKLNFLKQETGLEKYDGNLENFCAIGDDDGLLITINKELKYWFPTNDKAHSSEFKITFDHEEKAFSLIFENNRLRKSQQ